MPYNGEFGLATIPKVLGEMSCACIDPFYLTWKAREYGLDLIRQYAPL